MESKIRIKATIPEMKAFFDKDVGVRYYEIKDKRYTQAQLEGMSEDRYNSEVFTFSVLYRHMELEKPLAGTFTIAGLTKNRNCYFAVNSHSGLVDLFTNLAREDARAHERRPSVLGRLKSRPPEPVKESVKKAKEPSL